MNQIVKQKGMWAASRCRGASKASHWLFCVLLLIVFAGCAPRGGHEASESQERAKAPSPQPERRPPGTVELNEEAQRAVHLKIEPLSAVSVAPSIPAYGRVLDAAALVAAGSEWASARAVSAASQQELERVKTLRQQNTASVRALEAAEAAAVRDRLQVDSIRDRIALSWGSQLARRADLTRLTQALTSLQRVIVRVELPLGEGPGAVPRSARLTGLTDSTRSVEAEFLGRAPATDPQWQGEAFLFLTQDNPLNLTPGAAVNASLEFNGEAMHGVMLPDSTVVRLDTRTWVYLQTAPGTFVRMPIELRSQIPGGWLVTAGLRTADRVVTQGAQVLLSEELKAQTSLPD